MTFILKFPLWYPLKSELFYSAGWQLLCTPGFASQFSVERASLCIVLFFKCLGFPRVRTIADK